MVTDGIWLWAHYYLFRLGCRPLVSLWCVLDQLDAVLVIISNNSRDAHGEAVNLKNLRRACWRELNRHANIVRRQRERADAGEVVASVAGPLPFGRDEEPLVDGTGYLNLYVCRCCGCPVSVLKRS